MSGPAIKPIALAKVYEARKATTLPIIGIGGITSANDVLEFLIVGASMVQVGTQNFVQPDAGVTIADQLAAYCDEQGIESISELTNSLQVHADLRAQGW